METNHHHQPSATQTRFITSVHLSQTFRHKKKINMYETIATNSMTKNVQFKNEREREKEKGNLPMVKPQNRKKRYESGIISTDKQTNKRTNAN